MSVLFTHLQSEICILVVGAIELNETKMSTTTWKIVSGKKIRLIIILFSSIFRDRNGKICAAIRVSIIIGKLSTDTL